VAVLTVAGLLAQQCQLAVRITSYTVTAAREHDIGFRSQSTRTPAGQANGGVQLQGTGFAAQDVSSAHPVRQVPIMPFAIFVASIIGF
jgi:hypothetical protein